MMRLTIIRFGGTLKRIGYRSQKAMAIHRWTAAFLSIIKNAASLLAAERPSQPLNVYEAAEEIVSLNVFVIRKIAPRLEFHLCVPILCSKLMKPWSCVSSVERISKLMSKRRFRWSQLLAAAAVLVVMGCAGTGKDALCCSE
jgi:hypothetical protein